MTRAARRLALSAVLALAACDAGVISGTQLRRCTAPPNPLELTVVDTAAFQTGALRCLAR